jgi:hypothetical protein
MTSRLPSRSRNVNIGGAPPMFRISASTGIRLTTTDAAADHASLNARGVDVSTPAGAEGDVHPLLEAQLARVEVERQVLVGDGDGDGPHVGDVRCGLGHVVLLEVAEGPSGSFADRSDP